MARGWMSAVFTASWLGVCATAVAQPPPATMAPVPILGSGSIPGPATLPGLLPPGGLPASPAPINASPPVNTPLPGSPGALPTTPAPSVTTVPLPATRSGPAGLPQTVVELPVVSPEMLGCAPPQREIPVIKAMIEPLVQPPDYPYFSMDFDFITRWICPQPLPTLVTIGRIADAVPGAIGEPGTTQINGTSLSSNPFYGGKLTIGLGMDSSNDWSMDACVWGVEQRAGSQVYSGTGNVGTNPLTRPYYNLFAQRQDSFPVAYPRVFAGRIQIETPSQMWGGEANLRYFYWSHQESSRFVLLTGFRCMFLNETLGIHTDSEDLPGLGLTGNKYFSSEKWVTNNGFYGGQIGGDYEWRLGPISVNTIGKFAMGAVQQSTRISALSRVTEPNGIVTNSLDNALYVTPEKAGQFSRTRWAYIPECNVRLGLDCNKNVRFTLGYNYLFVSDVARPGSQVNQGTNLQPVGAPFGIAPLSPRPSINSTSFYTHGLEASVRLSF